MIVILSFAVCSLVCSLIVSLISRKIRKIRTVSDEEILVLLVLFNHDILNDHFREYRKTIVDERDKRIKALLLRSKSILLVSGMCIFGFIVSAVVYLLIGDKV